LVVEEASARYDMDVFYTEAADHFDVCRPQCRTSSIFVLFKNFVADVVDKVLNSGSYFMQTPKIDLKFVSACLLTSPLSLI
jgi:hypothetical protein